jgi:hypothetical protein
LQEIYQLLTDRSILNDESLSGKDQLLTVQNKFIIPIELLKKSKKLPKFSYLGNFHPNLGHFSGLEGMVFSLT